MTRESFRRYFELMAGLGDGVTDVAFGWVPVRFSEPYFSPSVSRALTRVEALRGKIPAIGRTAPIALFVCGVAWIVVPLSEYLLGPETAEGFGTLFGLQIVLVGALFFVLVRNHRFRFRVVWSLVQFVHMQRSRRNAIIFGAVALPAAIVSGAVLALGEVNDLPRVALDLQIASLVLVGPVVNEMFFREYVQGGIDVPPALPRLGGIGLVFSPGLSFSLATWLIAVGIPEVYFYFVKLSIVDLVPATFGLIGFGLAYAIAYRKFGTFLVPAMMHASTQGTLILWTLLS